MVHTHPDISYTYDTENERNRLDVYYSNKDYLRDVIVFFPGGAWESGNKETYSYLGRSFVKKGLIAVIVNYSLVPTPIYRIAQDCAAAVVWVSQYIYNYGGNPDRIFLMGHSAGGHLIELINSDRRFFAQHGLPNPIYGIILLDAFGLDMYEYLRQASPASDKYYNTFIQVFSNNPRIWKQASPMRYMRTVRNPHLIMIGERTYPSIRSQNKRFFGRLIATRQAIAEFHEIPRRNHSGMVIYMVFRSNHQYDIILDFMRRN